MSEQVMGAIINQMQVQGIPFTPTLAQDIDMALRKGFHCSEVSAHVKSALGRCGVELLLNKTVPTSTPPPVRALESSDKQKDFLLGLNLPGMEQILYGQGNK